MWFRVEIQYIPIPVSQLCCDDDTMRKGLRWTLDVGREWERRRALFIVDDNQIWVDSGQTFRSEKSGVLGLLTLHIAFLVLSVPHRSTKLISIVNSCAGHNYNLDQTRHRSWANLSGRIWRKLLKAQLVKVDWKLLALGGGGISLLIYTLMLQTDCKSDNLRVSTLPADSYPLATA